jgi:hypothetical protein
MLTSKAAIAEGTTSSFHSTKPGLSPSRLPPSCAETKGSRVKKYVEGVGRDRKVIGGESVKERKVVLSVG